MPQGFAVEAIGYLGSGLVLVSMLMKSVVRLRVINTVGSVIFTVYAIIIRSYPTAVMNACLVLINLWHLMKLRDSKRQFDVFEDKPDSGWVRFLLNRSREDIARFFPGFDAAAAQASSARVFVVMHQNEAAGLLMGVPEDDGLSVLLDYTTPVYRDCSVGRSLYALLKEKGVRFLDLREVPELHRNYALQMGFVPREDGGARLTL